jgi:hypothetical protein
MFNKVLNSISTQKKSYLRRAIPHIFYTNTNFEKSLKNAGKCLFENVLIYLKLVQNYMTQGQFSKSISNQYILLSSLCELGTKMGCSVIQQ